jgi:putative flippase GtrA
LAKLILTLRGLWEKNSMRFLVVGSLNTLLDFTILNLIILATGAAPLLANSISVTVGITISYFLNHKIVFRHHTSPQFKNYLFFLLTTGASVLVIQNTVIYFFTNNISIFPPSLFSVPGLRINHHVVEVNVAKALAVMVGMVWNFLLYKHFVFSSKKPKQ